MNGRIRQWRDDRGEIEDMPALIILIGGVLFLLAAALLTVGQIATAQTQIQAAAFAAARDVSLSRATDPDPTVVARATDAASTSLAGNVTCGTLTVTTDDAGLRRPVGVVGSVSATVTCTVELHTIRLPGIPTTVTITRTAASPVDPYREQQ